MHIDLTKLSNAQTTGLACYACGVWLYSDGGVPVADTEFGVVRACEGAHAHVAKLRVKLGRMPRVAVVGNYETLAGRVEIEDLADSFLGWSGDEISVGYADVVMVLDEYICSADAVVDVDMAVALDFWLIWVDDDAELTATTA